MPIDFDRGLLSDRIYDLVRAMIKDSTLKPGEQVVESQLARRLSVSQAPVREALKRLTHDGLVTHIRHHGSFVTEFSKREADDARIGRMALEGMAARVAHGRIDDTTRARLTAIVDSMHDAAERHDIAAFRETDFEFHRAVIEASGNVYLPRMWDILEPSLRSMHVLSDPGYDGDWRVVAETHRGLIASLDGGDPDEASDLFVAHAMGLATHPEHPIGPAMNRAIAAARAE
ncbi:GntR family transcriptional regulator [Agromyces sp. Root81]|uniref:GntR family transcriptional regulator n=1 Tax=Agromyces sp. Root81 TaxID=1736601 RepID=UPI0009EB7AA2|nr:GntR family transcriptional regulator [Agromyces sp. Root81]